MVKEKKKLTTVQTKEEEMWIEQIPRCTEKGELNMNQHVILTTERKIWSCRINSGKKDWEGHK
jgi:hypothetical protein